MGNFEKPEDFLPQLVRTVEQLDEFIEVHRGMTLDYLKNTQEEHWCPKLAATVLDYESGEEQQVIVALACDFSTYEEKHQTMYGLGAMFQKQNKVPVLVCMITEAWRSKEEKFCNSGKDGGLTPKDDPDKDEVLVFFGSTFGLTEQALGFIETDRHPDGYLLPGPLSKLIHDGGSALMKSFWVGIAESALGNMKKKNN